eukprot:3411937-Pyramimonas_sp.AAC.1
MLSVNKAGNPRWDPGALTAGSPRWGPTRQQGGVSQRPHRGSTGARVILKIELPGLLQTLVPLQHCHSTDAALP